jgi:hypothetical protein
VVAWLNIAQPNTPSLSAQTPLIVLATPALHEQLAVPTASPRELAPSAASSRSCPASTRPSTWRAVPRCRLFSLPGPHYQLLARSGAACVQLAIEGSGTVWVRRQDLEGVDIATPVSTEQPIVIANEQRRAAPTALAVTAAPPTPTGASLAPAPTVPRTIVYRNADGSVLAIYTCEPYGDWRDSDPMYVHPECSQ